MTFQPIDLNRRPNFRQPQSGRRGCLIGCGAVLLVLVVGAVALGLLAKHALDDFTGRNDPLTTTTANPMARQLTAIQYGQLVSRHGATLSTEANAIAQQCKNLAKVSQNCIDDVDAMHEELMATQDDLNGVKAPLALTNTDAKLRQSIADGIKGTGDVSAGANHNPLTFTKGLVEVAKAAKELKEAENDLNNTLAG